MTQNTPYPPVVVVDENDNEIGSAMTAEVWAKGLYHRVASIFVQDDKGRMLLQLRGAQVKVYPNCWDQAAGGHVDEGFTYEQAAVNELAEEVGIHNVPLETLGTFRTNNTLDDGRIINQFERVFVAHVPHDIELKPEESEVGNLQWFAPEELARQITEHPETCTPGLILALQKYFPTFAPPKAA